MTDCVKIQPHLFVFYLAFRAYFGVWGQTLFLDLPMQTINLAFGSKALSSFNLATLRPSFELFWPFRAIFWSFGPVFEVGVRFNNIFGTYQSRLLIFVLEVQLHLFVFNIAKFGAYFARFGPFAAIFGVRVRFKNFFYLPMQTINFRLGNTVPSFCF